MRILLLGSGAREHALAWAMVKSPRLQALFCAPGNPGIAEIATCVDLPHTDHERIIAFCKEDKIDGVVIGPEAPLVAGLVDDLTRAGIWAFGPTKAAAQLEGSKAFTKALCTRHGIPTAPFEVFTTLEEALSYIAIASFPLVLKADGLASGKGVVIAQSAPEAVQTLEAFFSGKFGDASRTVVIEAYLEGEEVSCFALCDGKTVLPLTTARDYKRAYTGDIGPNTGGMGAYSPARDMTPQDEREIFNRIFAPTVAAMAQEGYPYRGVLYAGIMRTQNGPYVIEYNVRFGDPECQVLMMRLETDFLDLLEATFTQTLDQFSLTWSQEPALAIVVAAKGYPDQPEMGQLLPSLPNAPDTIVFQAGTRKTPEGLRIQGGRIFSLGAQGASLGEARSKAYHALEDLPCEWGFYRRDIGSHGDD